MELTEKALMNHFEYITVDGSMLSIVGGEVLTWQYVPYPGYCIGDENREHMDVISAFNDKGKQYIVELKECPNMRKFERIMEEYKVWEQNVLR